MVEKWKEITLIEKIIIGILAILVVAIILLIVGVAKNENNRIAEGVVVDKNFSNAYTTVTYIDAGYTKIPQQVYHPATYSIKIQGKKDDETVEYWFECTAEEYQQYKIGDYYKK